MQRKRRLGRGLDHSRPEGTRHREQEPILTSEHFCAISKTLFRARLPTTRLRKAEKVFARLGMKASDAFNVFLA